MANNEIFTPKYIREYYESIFIDVSDLYVNKRQIDLNVIVLGNDNGEKKQSYFINALMAYAKLINENSNFEINVKMGNDEKPYAYLIVSHDFYDTDRVSSLFENTTGFESDDEKTKVFSTLVKENYLADSDPFLIRYFIDDVGVPKQAGLLVDTNRSDEEILSAAIKVMFRLIVQNIKVRKTNQISAFSSKENLLSGVSMLDLAFLRFVSSREGRVFKVNETFIREISEFSEDQIKKMEAE